MKFDVFNDNLLFLSFGIGCATAVAHELLAVPNQWVSLNYNLKICHYIDDSIQERPVDAPDHYQPLVRNYRRLGFYLSSEKRQIGTQIDFVGYTLDFAKKTVRIKASTVAKTLEKLTTIFEFDAENFGLSVGLDELESLLGSIGFLCNCSIIGRSRSSHLTNMLNNGRRDGVDKVVLDAPSYSEAQFWKAYCNSPTVVSMASKNVDLYQIRSYSDASGSRWAYLMYDGFSDTKVAGSGQFPAVYDKESILFKEAYALHSISLL